MTHKTDIDEVTQALTRKLTDDGKLVEAGWVIFAKLVLPENASQAQRNDMQVAFFAGAQHVWGSTVTLLEEGEEPTDADMRRIDRINNELTTFAERLKRDVERKGRTVR